MAAFSLLGGREAILHILAKELFPLRKPDADHVREHQRGSHPLLVTTIKLTTFLFQA
jgi:hypothetical protein